MAADISTTMRRLIARESLSRDEARGVGEGVLAGEWSDAQIASLLTALASKGETVDELAGLVEAMRASMMPIALPPGRWVDTCGTGGDHSGSFNVSTAAALVVAASDVGVGVLKHGNRSVSSRCGSADVLEALGVAVDLAPEAVEACLREFPIAFAFAPRVHPAMKRVGPVRRALGVPTAFNLLGPLCNPGRVAHQLVGVARREKVAALAEVLGMTGSDAALVVWSHDGLDEFSPFADAEVVAWREGELRAQTMRPREWGAPVHVADRPLAGGDASENAAIIRALLEGRMSGAERTAVALNAAAALWIAGAFATPSDALARADETLASGRAAQLLDAWARWTREVRSQK